MCSCVQIQRDALSTKGVKINVLFTFILTVTQQASEEFPVTFFSLSGARWSPISSDYGAAWNGVTVLWLHKTKGSFFLS